MAANNELQGSPHEGDTPTGVAVQMSVEDQVSQFHGFALIVFSSAVMPRNSLSAHFELCIVLKWLNSNLFGASTKP